VQHLSFHDPITGRLGTRHASSDIDETRFIYLFFKDIFILLYSVCVTVLLCDAEFEHFVIVFSRDDLVESGSN